MHIQTIGILVSEKTDLQTTLAQIQKKLKVKDGKFEVECVFFVYPHLASSNPFEMSNFFVNATISLNTSAFLRYRNILSFETQARTSC